MRKCPPGVICIENVSLFFIFITFLVIIFLFYSVTKNNHHHHNNTNLEKETVIIKEPEYTNRVLNYPYSNLPSDVLLNPYTPPLKDERYAVPINVPTNIGAVETSYRQVGILTPIQKNSKDMILSLMGRPVFTNRDLWQYYTISNQHNNVKLPLSVNGKSASNEYGVKKLFNGDTVYVEGYNSAFKTTIYDDDTIRYIPVV